MLGLRESSAYPHLPQIYRNEVENLFPNFTTVYAQVDGEFWFPVKTVADDVLPFSSGVQPVKYTIDYENYSFGKGSAWNRRSPLTKKTRDGFRDIRPRFVSAATKPRSQIGSIL